MQHDTALRTIWGSESFPLPGETSDDVTASPADSALDYIRDLIHDDDLAAVPFICRAAVRLIEFGYDHCDPDVIERIVTVGRADYEAHRASAATLADAAARELEQAAIAVPAPGEVVYYMRIGNRVKIGYSTNLTLRLQTINPEELMATEPGGASVEKRRHDEFRQLRTRGEWFHLDGPLIQHIAALRTAPWVGQPSKVALPTMTDDEANALIPGLEAARLAGVTVSAICHWVRRGRLDIADRNRSGRPLYRVIDVVKADCQSRASARRARGARGARIARPAA